MARRQTLTWTRAARGLALACVAALQAPPTLASGPGEGIRESAGGRGGSILSVESGEQGLARRVDLSIGRSLIVDLPREAKEVFVANPKVANAVVRSTRKVFVIGMENGVTSIFVMDAEGRQIASLDVTVGRDLAVLQQTLRSALPKAVIQTKPAGDSVLLTGSVDSAAEAQQAVDIANAFVGIAGTPGGAVKGAVINALTVRGKDQVMLQVTVVEVARTVLKQFGINTAASWSTPDFASDFSNVNPFPISPPPGGNFLSGTLSRGGFSVSATLKAFERAGVSRVLAEPTLTAISGESAKFTAGGEIPIPKSEDCSTAGGFRNCSIGVEYKPYGVTLSFTPVVLAENRISMRVATEVTEVDASNQIQIGNIAVPAMKVRKSETTVELPSGGVMMTAGLIQQMNAQTIGGLPGLANLPVLGALFRSRDYQRNETELMIMVTPFIAQPMEPSQAARPDDGFIEPHDAQTILLGRLNQIYGSSRAPAARKSAAPLAPRYQGSFGFITD
jgi:pilus assembly protein CpaC